LAATSPPSPRRYFAAAFLVAFATLVAQILFHRIISAKLQNSYAFLVISLTMLGFACSGVILSRYLARWSDRLDELVALWTALFVISSLGSAVIFYHAPTGLLSFASQGEFVLVLLRTLPLALLFAAPFLFAGLSLGLLLACERLPTQAIYCWDLLGSALGAVAVLPAIAVLGVESALLALCGFEVVAIALLLRPRPRGSQAWMAAAAAAVLAGVAWRGPAFAMRFQDGTYLAGASDPASHIRIEEIRWDPVSRIEVSAIDPPDPSQVEFPALVGTNPQFLSHFRKVLTQNNFAFTYALAYDGVPSSLAGIEDTIYAAAYEAAPRPAPKVAIIGVGGGFDVLTALRFDARQITGIEVNGATLDILQRDFAAYFAPWVTDPRVTLVHADGRNYLKQTPERFDIVQLSGVDSYSGTAGAAYVFSENYLYTREAVELYLSRLTDDGVINIMRLEQSPPREMLRVLATALAALRSQGIDRPAEHLAVVEQRDGHFAAVLIKRQPFTRAEEDHLAAWAGRNRNLTLLLSPHHRAPRSIFQILIDQGSPEREAALMEAWPHDIRPATDDRPFFFHFSRWRHLPLLFSHTPWAAMPNMRRQVPVMEITLLVLLGLIGFIAAACTWLPLRLAPPSAGVALAPARFGFVFAGTALAYLAVEVAMLQKFGLFLGHPNYSLSVVLAGLLFATGIGALNAGRLARRLRGPRAVSYLFALVVMGEVALVFPHLNSWTIDLLGLRVLVVLALLFPLGALMGTFIPLAVDQLKAIAPGAVPWAWGINGVFSVVAPILSIAFSMTFGIDALLLAAIPIYLVVGFLLTRPAARAA
jgi:spermidine synthase